MSLIEQLLVVSLVGLLAAIPIVTGGSDRDQLQLDASARRLQSGLDRARSLARRRACKPHRCETAVLLRSTRTTLAQSRWFAC